MKAAVTADCHLDSGRHPERTEALACVMDRTASVGAEALIIAGDLFDDGSTAGYPVFEELCRARPGLEVHVIPGNHDPNLSATSTDLANVTVHDAASVTEIGGFPFLFVPYSPGVRMAEAAAAAVPPAGRWALVGHGDYTTALRVQNEYEEGTYMPLTAADARALGPSILLLGHIHRPCSFDSPALHYPGSPCGMDINETGRRSFLVFDTESLSVSREPVDTGTVFLQARFTVIPEPGALERLGCRAADTVAQWEREIPDLRSRARIRVSAAGFTDNREGVGRMLRKAFRGFDFYDEAGPDLSALRESGDRRRSALARATEKVIEGLEWDFGDGEPSREDVLRRALALIWDAEVD
jgi:predicted phosphodiesterase